MHRVVEHRAIVVRGQVPEDGHGNKPEGGCEGMGEEHENGTQCAACEKRREQALAQDARQPGGKEHLRTRQEDERRPDAAHPHAAAVRSVPPFRSLRPASPLSFRPFPFLRPRANVSTRPALWVEPFPVAPFLPVAFPLPHSH